MMRSLYLIGKAVQRGAAARSLFQLSTTPSRLTASLGQILQRVFQTAPVQARPFVVPILIRATTLVAAHLLQVRKAHCLPCTQTFQSEFHAARRSFYCSRLVEQSANCFRKITVRMFNALKWTGSIARFIGKKRDWLSRFLLLNVFIILDTILDLAANAFVFLLAWYVLCAASRLVYLSQFKGSTMTSPKIKMQKCMKWAIAMVMMLSPLRVDGMCVSFP